MSTLEILTCLILITSLSLPLSADDKPKPEILKSCFDTVWKTVNENHYDSTFGGLDWNEIYSRYQDRMAGIADDDAFIDLMNEMLRELGLSHNSVFMMKEKATSGSPLVSEGSIGLDIRLLDNQAVIVSVKDGFPAAKAGLKPGFIIESVDGQPVEKLLDSAKDDLPDYLNERGRLNTLTDEIANRFFGKPDVPITLTYRDGSDSVQEVTLKRKARTGKSMLSKDLPPFYVDFAARRLPADLGYIYFSAFLPPAAERFGAALDSMSDLRGLIIDIRGNPGGSHEIGEAIASRLVDKETVFSVFKYRDHTKEVVVQPKPPIFEGPVVILLDYMNGSASERFSGCMQSIGRAAIIGEQSPGIVGPSDIKKLPNGASFMYLVAQSLTPDGKVLEGHGVIPDISASLDRASLLEGDDRQLQRAMEYIDSVSD